MELFFFFLIRSKNQNSILETSLCSQLSCEVRDVRMLGAVWSDAARRTTLKLFLTRLSVFIFIPLNFYSQMKFVS